jgi:hypothetical protein
MPGGVFLTFVLSQLILGYVMVLVSCCVLSRHGHQLLDYIRMLACVVLSGAATRIRG